MNYSCIATIQKNGIYLHNNILDPLGASKRSPIWGLFYPNQYPGRIGGKDIMLTPIPFEFWPCSARIKVRLKHEAATLAGLTGYLAERKIIVLSCSVSRSAHRYATAVMTIAFGDLVPSGDDTMTPEARASVCQRTRETLERLLSEIHADLSGVCFSHNEPENLKESCWGAPLDALQYFWKKTIEQSLSGEKSMVLRVSRFTYVDKVIRPDGSGYELLEYLFHDNAKPTRGFAEADTADMNMRIALIDQPELSKFASVKIPYRWQRPQASNETSSGILADLAWRFGKNFELWRYSSEFKGLSGQMEIGQLNIVAQLVDDVKDDDVSERWSELEKKLSGPRFGPGCRYQTEPIKLTRFSDTQIFLSSNFGDRFRFIHDLCVKMGSEFGLTRDDWRVSDSRTTAARDSVARDIRRSQGMLQYYRRTEDGSQSYVWPEAEHLSAITWGIPVIVMKDEDVPDDVPRTNGGQPPVVVPSNASPEEREKAFADGIRELVDAIRSSS